MKNLLQCIKDWYESAPRWQAETAAFSVGLAAGLLTGKILCWLS